MGVRFEGFFSAVDTEAAPLDMGWHSQPWDGDVCHWRGQSSEVSTVKRLEDTREERCGRSDSDYDSDSSYDEGVSQVKIKCVYSYGDLVIEDLETPRQCSKAAINQA